MPTSTPDSGETVIDPDDAPRLTKEFFKGAEIREAGSLVRTGRTRTEPPREQISVRLDIEVLARLREHGPGWQSRMNPLLRQVLCLDTPAAMPTASTEMHRILEEITLLRRDMANTPSPIRADESRALNSRLFRPTSHRARSSSGSRRSLWKIHQ